MPPELIVSLLFAAGVVIVIQQILRFKQIATTEFVECKISEHCDKCEAKRDITDLKADIKELRTDIKELLKRMGEI